MFCPQCGTETHEQLKFCKQCGTNLRRVQGVLGKGGAGFKGNEAVDWNRVALEEYQEERERNRKKSPEEKRLNEIKGGVITSCVGLGVTIFLFFLFSAIANAAPEPEQQILRAIPFAGLIPFLIGLGIIFNGLFISKRIVELKRQREQTEPTPRLFPVADTAAPQLAEPKQQSINDFSVTEPTTTRLGERLPVAPPRNHHS
jgi:hypothetical protein